VIIAMLETACSPGEILSLQRREVKGWAPGSDGD